LATDIEHAVSEVADDEGGLGDTSGLDTRSQNVLVIGNVVRGGNAVDRIEVATFVSIKWWVARQNCSLFGRVVELILARPLEALLYASILPKYGDGVSNLRGQAVALNLRRLHENSLDVVLGALVVERELKRLHGLEDDAHRLDRVAEDDLLERLPLVARVAALVDELHLLEYGRLARLSGTCALLDLLCDRRRGVLLTE
jgi:hypothetical protein